MDDKEKYERTVLPKSFIKEYAVLKGYKKKPLALRRCRSHSLMRCTVLGPEATKFCAHRNKMVVLDQVTDPGLLKR